MVVEDRTLRVSWVSSSPFSSTVTTFEWLVRVVEKLATLSTTVNLEVLAAREMVRYAASRNGQVSLRVWYV